MASSRSQYIAALDVGSAKVACAIAVDEPGGFRVIGASSLASRGIRRGAVTDMEAAEHSIRHAVDLAERSANVEIDRVYAALSGGSPASHTVGVEIAAPDRQIEDRDVHRLLRLAGARSEPGERSLLHAIPVDFTLDGMREIADPRGMRGRRLSVDVHIVTAGRAAQSNLEACIGRAHLKTGDLIASAYASGLGALSWDERDLGAVVVDIGAGVTRIGVFEHGALVFLDGIGIGGSHVTNDIARILSLPIDTAEQLKILKGDVNAGSTDDAEILNGLGIGDAWSHRNQQISRSLLISVIRPRIEEILETVRERIEASGRSATAGRKVVLTGGGSLLNGLERLAEQMLNAPVRTARPQGLRGLPKDMDNPFHTGLAGCLAFAGRRLEARAQSRGKRLKLASGFARFGRWLKEAP